MNDPSSPPPLRLYFEPFKSSMYARFRGLPFRRVRLFQWDTAVVWRDLRLNWGDERYVAVGLIEGHAHAMRFAIQGDRFAVISMRRLEGRPHRIAPEPEWMDDGLPELSDHFYARARPAAELMGEALVARAPGRHGPRPRGKFRPLTIEVKMRIEADVWRRIAATGRRWPERVNAVLGAAFGEVGTGAPAAGEPGAEGSKREALRVVIGGKAESAPAEPVTPLSKIAG